MMTGVLTIQFNDIALAALRVIGPEPEPLPDPRIASELEHVLSQGIIRRGHLLTSAGSHGNADTAPGRYGDPQPDLACMRSGGARVRRLVRVSRVRGRQPARIQPRQELRGVARRPRRRVHRQPHH
jgi:hypothetical protein